MLANSYSGVSHGTEFKRATMGIVRESLAVLAKLAQLRPVDVFLYDFLPVISCDFAGF